MGGCCSCGENPKQIDRDEAEAPNPKAPYADWAELLKGDWGSDPTAVSRDFGRMRVMVTGPGGPSVRVADSLRADDVDAIARRNAELKDVTVAISRLIEPEGSDVPDRIAAAWERCIGDGAASPDVSRGLARLLSEELGFYSGRDDVKADALERSPTFNALLLMAQGTVFYPGQRMAHLVWFPWARNLRDTAWTVYVTDDDRYPAVRYYADKDAVLSAAPGAARAGAARDAGSPAGEDARLLDGGGKAPTPAHSDRGGGAPVSYGAVEDDGARPAPAAVVAPVTPDARTRKSARAGTVSVVHSFAMRNYIEEDAKATTPAFMVQWAVVITLKKGTGEWVGASLEQPEVFCVRPRGKLMKLRRQRLCDAVFNAFGVQVQEVDSL